MISTLGYVKTDCRDLFLIRQKLQCALVDFAKPNKYTIGIPKKFLITYELESNWLVAIFDNGQDHRRLNVTFPEGFIMFSLANWGNSIPIIQSCLAEFQDLGEIFIHENDCIGEPEKYEP